MTLGKVGLWIVVVGPWWGTADAIVVSCEHQWDRMWRCQGVGRVIVVLISMGYIAHSLAMTVFLPSVFNKLLEQADV